MEEREERREGREPERVPRRGGGEEIKGIGGKKRQKGRGDALGVDKGVK